MLPAIFEYLVDGGKVREDVGEQVHQLLVANYRDFLNTARSDDHIASRQVTAGNGMLNLGVEQF